MFCSRSPCDSMVESLKQQYPSTKIIHVACDVSTKEGRTVLVEAAKEQFGGTGVHGLVNNVGINVRKSVLEQTEEEFYNMIQTNVESAYFLCKMFSDLFDPAGATIVNVSSAAGVQSSGTGAAYGLSKAALNQYTKILACEWAARKIRVNAVAPW
jgi:Tropinone reductase 1